MSTQTTTRRDPLTPEQEQFLHDHINDAREAEVFQNFSSRYRDTYLRYTTEEQREVVRCLEGPVFVSAGAGTGKTETLTRRVVYALTEGSAGPGEAFLHGLDEALIITFTNDAANTIKERLRAALYANDMRKYAHEVDNAWISTIHGMCSRIIRENALELNVDTDFGTLEAERAEELKKEAATTAINRALKGEFGFDREQEQQRLREFINEYGHKGSKSKGNSCDSMVTDLLTKSEENPGGLNSVVYALPDGSFAPADAFEVELLPEADSEHQADPYSAFKDVARFVPTLHKLALVAEGMYREYKDTHALLDYADLLRMAHTALTSNETVRNAMRDKFHLIMVDEFQDTSQIQVDTITELAGPGKKYLATVGDAQQSIYRFRGADVGVFKASRADEANKQLTLTKNWRSHQDILNFVEHVCKGNRMIDEDEFLHLNAGFGDEHFKQCFKKNELPRVYVEAEATARQLDTSRKAVAAMIADRLATLHEEQEIPLSDMTLLMGKLTSAGIYVNALRERGLAAVMAKGSIFYQLPEVEAINALLICFANSNDTENGLIPLLASPLFMLNDEDFVHLSATKIEGVEHPTLWDQLCAPATAKDSAVLKHAREVLSRANELLPQLSPAELCRQVIEDSGWLKRLYERGKKNPASAAESSALAAESSASAAESSAQVANIMRALNIIRDLSENRGWGLAELSHSFLSYLENAQISPAQLSGSELEAVRIMSIHGSKGLEFPVVVLTEFYEKGSSKGRLSIVRQGEKLYCCLVPSDKPTAKVLKKVNLPSSLKESASIASSFRYLEALEEQAEREEDARKIYVGLTRAQDALIVGMAFGKDAFEEDSRNEWALRAITHEPPYDFIEVSHPFFEELESDEFDLSARMRFACAWKEDDEVHLEVESETPESRVAIEEAFYRAIEQVEPEEADEASADEEQFGIYALDPVLKLERPLKDDASYSFSSASTQVSSKHTTSSRTTEAADNPDEVPEESTSAEEEEGLSRRQLATNFGSAVHAGCELMVRLGLSADESLSAERVAALARSWSLPQGSTSDKKGADDLAEALRLWADAPIREQLLEWGELIEAEVPFFVEASARFGAYMNGYIDLLASDKERKVARVLDYKTGYLGMSEKDFQAAHEMQANFYAYALLDQGYEQVECDFLAVQAYNEQGEALRAHYGPFSRNNPPTLEWK